MRESYVFYDVNNEEFVTTEFRGYAWGPDGTMYVTSLGLINKLQKIHRGDANRGESLDFELIYNFLSESEDHGRCIYTVQVIMGQPELKIVYANSEKLF